MSDRQPGWSTTLAPSATHELIAQFRDMESFGELDALAVEKLSCAILYLPNDTLEQRIAQYAAWVTALAGMRAALESAPLKDTP